MSEQAGRREVEEENGRSRTPGKASLERFFLRHHPLGAFLFLELLRKKPAEFDETRFGTPVAETRTVVLNKQETSS